MNSKAVGADLVYAWEDAKYRNDGEADMAAKDHESRKQRQMY